jgi:hypothetical protein
MDSRAQELIKHGDALFSGRSQLMTLLQEIAENFYPIRADFTTKITLGDDITSHLSTSYPILAHRDMTNALSAMLRQRGVQWFGIRTGRKEADEGRALEWLEWATDLQYRATYDRAAQFVRATKEGDADFAGFGQAVLYVDTNRDGDTLLFRNYHIRDVAWVENAEGVIDTVHRKWKPTARDLVFDFPGKVHKAVTDLLEKDPFHKIECRHIMVPTSRAPDAPAAERQFKFRSYFIDVENQHVMEDVPSRLLKYVIPRWQTVSGSAYAYSPAAIAALPDARMIQAMTYSLLDATEKAVQPPMIGQANMVKSDLELWSGGTTWVDAEYDERLGEALRPIPVDLRGLPMGVDMTRDARAMIAEAFFLNKISLPPAGAGEMTAYETSQRVQEYIRQALPLFEPMEVEYNGALCDMTFATLMQGNAFGSPEDMPQELSDAEVEFKFVSPLQRDEERQDASTYLETKAILAEAAELEPGLAHILNGREALRDALKGAGAPARWIRDDDEMDEIDAELAEQQQAAQAMNEIERGGQVAEQVGVAAQAVGDVNV